MTNFTPDSPSVPDNSQPTRKRFPFEEALRSILSIPEVVKAKLIEKEDNYGLDNIRVLSDGSIPDKQVAGKVQSVLLLDIDYHVSHKVIKVVSRGEGSRIKQGQ